jgi:hypothetical protein
MSKILVRRGQRVSQGQVIGLVGSTGLATGPHVCYRFWKNGVQVDATIKITYWRTYDGSNKSRFMNKISPLKFRWTVQIYNRIHNDQKNLFGKHSHLISVLKELISDGFCVNCDINENAFKTNFSIFAEFK